MASGPQQQQHQQQQQQQQHEQFMQHQQNHQMQFSPPNHAVAVAGLVSANFDQQQQQMHQHNTMSPNATAPISVNHAQGHIISMNPHQQQHHHQPLMSSVGTGSLISQSSGNQSTSHIQQQQQQKSQILPSLLSPSLTPNSNDQTEQSETDHEQIIDQVISLENEFSDTSGMLASVDTGAGLMINHQQQQQHHLGDINLSAGGICLPDSNQFSSSSEDLLNLLAELEPSNLIGLGNGQQVDQDEKVGIENIRKQLMSCEVQSEQPQHQNTNSMSPIINQMTCQQPRSTQQQQQQQQQQHRNSVHQQQVTQQIISQTANVITHHQQVPTSGPSQQQQQHQQQTMSAEQSMMHGPYSNVSMSTVPVSSSGQSYSPQQSQQHVIRIPQSNPMSIVNNSPSPSWQQPQLSPYSSQAPHNNSRTSSQRQGQQHHPIHQQQHPMQQHQATTSPQMQQLHHTLQQRSPSQSVSPPATTEPSPVVKKNPLLNAQLVNSRAPSITPTRFMNSQANVMNQNPILNAKLSQGPFVTTSVSNVVGGPANPGLNSQSRFMQQTQQQTNFNYDISQQQQIAQQSNPQQAGHMNLYGPGDQQSQQQQSTNQVFRTTSTSGGGASMTSSSGNVSQQVKQEIRRKVQQTKQPQSLLKQLLSDDNK